MVTLTGNLRLRQFARLLSGVVCVVAYVTVLWLIRLPCRPQAELWVETYSEQFLATEWGLALTAPDLAARDAKHLQELAGRSGGRLQFVDQNERSLSKFGKRRSRMPLIVYVGLRGRVEHIDDGKKPAVKVFLLSQTEPRKALSSETSANDSDPWTLLEQHNLWKEVMTAREQFPARPILMLVNVTPPRDAMRFGQAGNEVAAAVAEQFSEKHHVDAIAACADSQTSWNGTQLSCAAADVPTGQSAFGFFISRALQEKGVADGELQKDDGTTLREFYQYLSREVAHWTDVNRKAIQQPGLFPKPKPDDSPRQDPRLVISNRRSDSGRLRLATLWEFFTKKLRNRSVETKSHGGEADPGPADDPNTHEKLVALMESQWKELLKGYASDDPPPPIVWRQVTQWLRRAEDLWLFHDDDLGRKCLDHAAEVWGAWKNVRERVPAHFEFEKVVGQDVNKPEEHFDGIRKAMTSPPWVRNASDKRIRLWEVATRLREKAEQVASRDARVQFLIRTELVKADRERRFAEDRLMLADAQLNEAKESLNTASEQFQSLENTRQILRDGVLCRDRSWCVLPDWAEWARERQPRSQETRTELVEKFRAQLKQNTVGVQELPNAAELRKLLDGKKEFDEEHLEILIACLFDSVNELDKSLTQLFRDPDVGAETRRSLIKRVEDVTGLAERDRKRISQQMENQAKKNGEIDPQRIDWRQLADCLPDSLLPSLTRADLLRKLHDREPEDSATVGENVLPTKTVDSPTEASKTKPPQDMVRRWHGLWGIQECSLGYLGNLGVLPDRVQPLVSLDAFQPDRLIHDLWLTWRREPADSHTLSSQLFRIGNERRQANVDISKRDDPSKEKKRALLLSWEQLASALTAADLVELKQSTVGGFPERARHLHLADTALHQADRYLEDFWHDWYDEAARRCRDFAAKQMSADPALNAWDQKLVRYKKGMMIPDFPTAAIPLGKAGTEGRSSAQLRVTTDPVGLLPEGIQAWWLEIEKTEDRRKGVEVDGPVGLVSETNSRRSELLDFHFRKSGGSDNSDGCLPIPFRPIVYFRGHNWESRFPTKPQAPRISVSPCESKGITLTYQPVSETDKRTGSIQVSGSDTEPSTLIFVLDCSGSMNESLRPGVTRFSEAKERLKNQLTEIHKLARAGRPLNVGLVAFPNKNNVPRVVQEPKPLNDLMLRSLKSSIDELKADGTTPMLQALLDAVELLELSPVVGGTIVVITDGVYNDGWTPNKINGDATLIGHLFSQLETQIRRLRANGSVVFHIIGFNLADPQLPEKKQELKKHLQSKAADDDNDDYDFHDDPKGQKLESHLKLATKPRQFRVIGSDPPDNRIVKDEPLGGIVSPLPAGRYRIEFPPGQLLQECELGGEALQFKIEKGRLVPQFPTDFHAAPKLNSSAAQLKMHVFPTRLDQGTLRLKVTLEGQLQNRWYPSPSEVSFLVRPKDELSLRSRSTTISRLPGKQLPTWQVDVSDWPEGRQPELQAVFRFEIAQSLFQKPLLDCFPSSQNSISLKPVISGTAPKISLEIKKAEFSDSNRRLEMILKVVPAGQESLPLETSLVRMLEGWSFHLRRNTQPATSLDVNRERRILYEEGEIRLSFDSLPSGLRPQDVDFAIVDDSSGSDGAATLPPFLIETK